MQTGVPDHVPDLAHGVPEISEVALGRRDALLPVPLVDIRAVVVIEEIVLPDRAHVGADALAGLAFELGQRHALPLRGRLNDLRLDTLFEPEPAGEFHRRARTIAV